MSRAHIYKAGFHANELTIDNNHMYELTIDIRIPFAISVWTTLLLSSLNRFSQRKVIAQLSTLRHSPSVAACRRKACMNVLWYMIRVHALEQTV
jgi:hypothetical protein